MQPISTAERDRDAAEAQFHAAHPIPPSSVRHLDVGDAAVQSLIERLGGLRAGESATLLTLGTYMHWHANGQWRDVPLRYLSDNRKGFLLSGVAPGTPIEYTTHVKIGVSHNHFYSIDRTLEGDLEPWGAATHATS
ncbi:MAG TPA: hypothetical protein V6D47_04145 [Oscillatoriaceae cyanobacterium]